MAKKEETPELKDDAKTITQQSVEPENKTKVNKKTPWPLITIGVFGTIVTIAFVIVAWVAIVATIHGTKLNDRDSWRESSGFDQRQDRGFSMPERQDSWSSEAVRGVVIAVNGNEITIAGQGEQTKVTKSDDTVIGGDKTTVEVNDTVVILGETQDDDSLIAERIIIRNETGGLFDDSRDWSDRSRTSPRI